MTDATSSAAAANATPAAESPKAKGPLRGLYNWVLKLAGSKHAEPWLFGISFAESSFFPIPPDVMLAPMCFARPERAYRYALVCTIASVFGALLGYAIGYWLFETVGSAIISVFGYGGKEEELRAQYAEYGAWIIFIKGVTPIPFKLVTIVSGAMAFSVPIFIAACVVTRGVRFFLVAWLFKTFGPTLAPVIEKRIGLFALLFVVVLVGGFVVAAMMH
ncbi:MAG TPA: YqaA family protein [Hyphomonadaceae bacterium]|jgi:membrane protein YqaA with SNARE-associated domain